MGKVTYTVFDGEIISENRDGVKRDYVSDSQGSTIALLDSDQNITDTWEYWPYGEIKSHTGSSDTPFTYVGTYGYYRDPGELTYVRARYYSASIAAWTTSDAQQEPRGSLYSYAQMNPTSLIDPTGNQSVHPSDVRFYPGRDIGSHNCKIIICSVHGFRDDDSGWYDWNKVTHQYVCAVTYAGRKCSGGLYDGTIGNMFAKCKSHVKSDGTVVNCKTTSTSCFGAALVCECIKRFRNEPPDYILPTHVCYHFKYDIKDCIKKLYPAFNGMDELFLTGF